MIDRFSELMQELGKIFGLSLHPDKYNALSIEIPPLTIQLELDPTQENLFFFTKVIPLPPGKFRENVLAEALKFNNLLDPKPGVFGYIEMTNHLTLHQVYPVTILSGEKVAGLFGAFFELASSWQKAIESGHAGPPQLEKSIPFGIRP
jgi:hypothetical protein